MRTIVGLRWWCLFSFAAGLALLASFYLDAGAQAWIAQHQDAGPEKFHAGREPLRRLARARYARTCSSGARVLAPEQEMDADRCRHDCGVRPGRCCCARHKDIHGSRPPLGPNGSCVERPEPQRALQRISIRAHRCVHRVFCDSGPGLLAARRAVPRHPAPDRLFTNVCRGALSCPTSSALR